ncbi:exo-beta-D-glucosaminidase [Fusarium circinatum]|uniref:Exo-beta-D-glucosaminidase n=1 Tax=Fusarium circinatum TaxID=48490 RepID=A0A8H5TFX6_FUSCI|nr:exo-beta-D-glucosaminidase [Fusarium circinatum]
MLTETIQLRARDSTTVALPSEIQDPELTYSIGFDTSDISPRTKFGIRTVSSELNAHNDVLFKVNGYPIQIRGGGYTSDMFLRWDPKRFEYIARYVLDMGMNAIHLEGKMEHLELYEIADRLGIMVIAGWECCDRWEAWPYNDDISEDPPRNWSEAEYETADASIRHEAAMMQTHPSMIAFLRYTLMAYMTLDGLDPLLGSEPELGAGVGTPTKGSLTKFLTDKDMEDLWKNPNKGLYHMSQNTSQFYDRSIYNKALFARYGKPTSLDDYLMKAQMMDYEAIRSEFEGWASQWSASRPATGLIYWMLNNAWPSLHWNQFDYYLHPAGSYFGTKIANRVEHVAFDYFKSFIWIINHSLDQSGPRSVHVDLVDLKGNHISHQKLHFTTEPNKSQKIGDIGSSVKKIKDVGVLRLLLVDDDSDKVLSRNAYWLSKQNDVVDWTTTAWYSVDVKQSANFTALNKMDQATITASASKNKTSGYWKLLVENNATVPAVFVQLNLVGKNGDDVTPLRWSDNYFTLLPRESIEVELTDWSGKGAMVQVDGKNVKTSWIKLH